VISDVIQNPARAEDLERVKTQLIAERSTPGQSANAGALVGGALTTASASMTSAAGRIASVPSPPNRSVTRRRNGSTRSVR